MKLRPYQSDAIDSIICEFARNDSTLLVLPTGMGKTICFAELIRRTLTAHPGKRAMVLAHREELIRQAVEKIERVTGWRAEVEMADERADSMFPAPVVVSTVQTQIAGGENKERYRRFNPEDFALLICDESHHAVADSWIRVIGHYRTNPALKLLGVTATPDRTDEEALGQVFESCAYRCDISDAIHDGWLVPVSIGKVVVQGLSYDDVRTTAGELNSKDVAMAQSNESVLHAMVKPVVELATRDNLRTLVFAAPGYLTDADGKVVEDDDGNPIQIGDRVCELFNRYAPGSARRVHQGTPKDERRQMILDYAAGAFRYFVNVGVLTEGFDDPGIECVAVMRPTKSRSLYAQMIGRGTRALPGVVDGPATPEARVAAIRASGKKRLVVLDVVGVSTRHDLATPLDVLGGRVSSSTLEEAGALIDDEPTDFDELIEEADESLDAKRQAREATEAEKRRRAAVMARVRFNVQKVLGLEPPDDGEGVMSAAAMTDGMRQRLERYGVEAADVDRMSGAEAARLIADLGRRSALGLCTYKQARLLSRAGYDPKYMKFEDASATIGQLMNSWKGRGWKPKQPTASQSMPPLPPPVNL